MRDDARLIEAKGIPIKDVADRLELSGLDKAGHEMIGPCPKCGGKDRFGINTTRGVFNCRTCGGGDGIALVQLALGCDFKAALAWLVGEQDITLSPAELDRRKREIEDRQAAAERRATYERDKAIKMARAIWQEGVPASGTMVHQYLAKRGIVLPDLPKCLRFHGDLRYTIKVAGDWREIHRGPAMLAAIQEPSDKFIGVHRTWIDLNQPKGKAVISHLGETKPSKKVLGSKKGGAIRLTSSDHRCMVMGEGIETTFSAQIADAMPDAAYWCGVDLGNMSGRRDMRGKGTRYAGIPDLSDKDSFLPPPWIQHLVFIQDGDSEPKSTRAKLEAGLRRANAIVPGVERVSIVHAGEGIDLNDALMGASTVDHGEPE